MEKQVFAAERVVARRGNLTRSDTWRTFEVGWGAQLAGEGEKGGDVWRRVGEERERFL